MNRVEFTTNIVALLKLMIDINEHPIIDFAKRSDEEQQRLYRIGRDENGNKIGKTVTNCDGVSVISQHQLGKAMDIYFIEDGKLSDPKMGWEYYHQLWQSWGGAPMIEWDKGHFEG